MKIEKQVQITENYLELLPAFGRDYKSAKGVIQAFMDGKDFQMTSREYSGAYCSVRDFVEGTVVLLRYRNKKMVTEYTVSKADALLNRYGV